MRRTSRALLIVGASVVMAVFAVGVAEADGPSQQGSVAAQSPFSFPPGYATSVTPLEAGSHFSGYPPGYTVQSQKRKPTR
jgi:hypothetical protein